MHRHNSIGADVNDLVPLTKKDEASDPGLIRRSVKEFNGVAARRGGNLQGRNVWIEGLQTNITFVVIFKSRIVVERYQPFAAVDYQ